MMYINKFMKKKNLPVNLQITVRKYLDYVEELESNLKEQEIFEDLSLNLRDELITFINNSVLKKTKIYTMFSHEFSQKLLYHFEEDIYGPDEIIFKVIFYFTMFSKYSILSLIFNQRIKFHFLIKSNFTKYNS